MHMAPVAVSKDDSSQRFVRGWSESHRSDACPILCSCSHVHIIHCLLACLFCAFFDLLVMDPANPDDVSIAQVWGHHPSIHPSIHHPSMRKRPNERPACFLSCMTRRASSADPLLMPILLYSKCCSCSFCFQLDQNVRVFQKAFGDLGSLIQPLQCAGDPDPLPHEGG
jgi:hypothetical protein